ncbi:zinc ABC transporter substrate-binding protein AdcA [Halobacillus litoralis]|uniref:zinc ABC transporter substrate-binding protein AdcA n=1 Tax=Halobacillus litoralis TaxID=45668 RepID=UPI00136CE59F|nr:zinc ABC transporter substrate-binding protein AdcA [Halobacillus litoralis]MYL37620.1 ZinT/AdcA family metal-binding protein [Halobacillus litoralis]
MKKIFGAVGLFAFILLLTACGEEESSSSEEGEQSDASEELNIYTTVYPLQYFAEQIAGEQADVQSILPPGSDPHTYEPTSKEMIEMAEADAFIYNGAGLEPYAEKISDSIKSEDVKILEASMGIELKEHAHNHEEEESSHEDEHAGHNHGDQDPHVWLDPVLSIQVAENIKDTLVELNPGQEDTYNENFQELKSNLEELDQEFHDQLEAAPKNKFIVSHAAYGYWEQSYGVEQVSVSGLSPTNEPSQKDLEAIVETAEQHNIKHVFFEQNVTPKVADVVRKEIGAESLRLHNLSVLTEEDINNEEDYFTLMQRNLEVLTEGLSGEPSDSEESSESEEHSEHNHNHGHADDEEAQQIYDGYFEDGQVEDRELTDWEGDWQSVYPYLQDGTLDEVFAHKAENDGDMTAEEYKEYYKIGYETDVERIIFDGNDVTFFEDGEKSSGTYTYDGYEILTYEAGNRGVRYIYELTEEDGDLPQYIQFSDHSIAPTDADHYHLYWGDDREALLDEVTNWPTYYPSDMDGHEIAHEMMAH